MLCKRKRDRLDFITEESFDFGSFRAYTQDERKLDAIFTRTLLLTSLGALGDAK